MINQPKNKRGKYAVIGVLFGLTFPIAAVIADCFFFNAHPVSFDSVVYQIRINPIHFIILLAPIVLGITFYLIGNSIDKQNKLNKQLYRANKAIRNSNELLDTFNYHVSHDLKTVLNNQLILTKMLDKYTDQNDIERIKGVVEKIQFASENGLMTVKNFLMISKQGFVQSKEKLKRLNVESEVGRILRGNNLLGKVNVTFGEQNFSTLKVHEKVLESILLNLFSNSIKYRGDNFPEVLIVLKRNKEKRQLIFKDNGIGIDMDKHGEVLFKPFNRIENDSVEGTGVGLFLVKKILNSIDADIKVKSKLGEGTTFTLTFYAA